MSLLRNFRDVSVSRRLLKNEGEENPNCITFKGNIPFLLSFRENSWHGGGKLEYSVNKKKWIDATTIISPIAAQSNFSNEIYVRGSGINYLNGQSPTTGLFNFSKFHPETETQLFISISGDLNTLINYNNETPSWRPDTAYYALFQDNQYIRHAENLIISNLSGITSCSYMFKDCVNLLTPPIFADTTHTIGRFACSDMFSGCTSLNVLPILPSKKLSEDGVYRRMFQGCASIKLSMAYDASEYRNLYKIPFDGYATTPIGTDIAKDMFKDTGGTYTSDPIISTQIMTVSYYTSNDLGGLK